jgi:endonuclease/exonuclease/phosphatase (EEP) superfamily protein YafD
MLAPVTGFLALLLTAVALPPLLARLIGGHAPRPGPQLAALAPVATLPALAAVGLAAVSEGGWGGGWGLAVLLAVPASILLAWQLPPFLPNASARSVGPVGPGGRAANGPAASARPASPRRFPASPLDTVTVRVLTLNSRGGSADVAALLAALRQHAVDVLAVQELTWDLVRRLGDAGLGDLLPHTHLDPRPDSPGTGLWARWPLTPLESVPGLVAAAPRARAEPVPGRPVVLTSVHPLTPMRDRGYPWQRDLARLLPLAQDSGPQVVMGDFNASRDHQPFRDLLAAGFVDAADAAQHRTWPGFTWPVSWDLYSDRDTQRFPDRRAPAIMRLDHVLVTRAGSTVHAARPVRIPGTDHQAVLAVIEFT